MDCARIVHTAKSRQNCVQITIFERTVIWVMGLFRALIESHAIKIVIVNYSVANIEMVIEPSHKTTENLQSFE